MTRLLAIVALMLMAQPQTPPTPTAVPVVIELFTSEGCSSCPPADEVLTRLVSTQPVEGAQIIALGKHVDYWDRLGWRDAFSSPTFSRRQTEYADRVFRHGNIYTPQLVINGRQEIVGSDYHGAVSAISKAAKTAGRLRVTLAIDSSALPVAKVSVSTADGTPVKNGAEVWLAIVENGLTTKVARGENGGRTLHHSAVVRTMRALATTAASSSMWNGSVPLALAPDWSRPNTLVVAFVQDRSSREILGAAVARP